jgi:hypothetical protein
MVALKFMPSQGEFDIAKRPDNTLINPELDDKQLHMDLMTEHSLGIGVQNNLVSRIIDQGTSIPVSRRQGGFTNAGPTDYVDVPVYQGEGDYSFQNTLIGTLRIGPMEPKPEGMHQFEVTFSLDDNGLLAMTVHHINEGKDYQGKFEQKTGVGGVDALTVRRNKLLKMYIDHPTTDRQAGRGPTAPVAPVAAAGPPMPAAPSRPRPVAASPVPGPAQPAMAIPSPTPIPPQPSQPAPVQPRPMQPQPVQAQPVPPQPVQAQPVQAQSVPPQPVPAQPTPGLPSGGTELLQPVVEVPAEFKSLIRRAQKLLSADGSPKLRAALNQFVSLLNSGAPSDALEEAGDELADVYHDSR